MTDGPAAAGDPPAGTGPVVTGYAEVLGGAVAHVGRTTIWFLAQLGGLTQTAGKAAGRLLRSFLPGERLRLRTAADQAFLMGASALPIVGLIAMMMGLILAFNSAYQLDRLGAIQYIPSLVAVAITRELGPVITAIVVAGRSGSAIAAEIASMKIQEEIDALEVMGLNPIAFLVSPKLLAMLVALPLLTALADLLGILGGLACAVLVLDMSATKYLDSTIESLLMKDFVSGLVKAVVFGAVIVSVGAWCGFSVSGGAEGVGRATTRAVVVGILLVIVTDLLFTGLFYNFG